MRWVVPFRGNLPGLGEGDSGFRLRLCSLSVICWMSSARLGGKPCWGSCNDLWREEGMRSVGLGQLGSEALGRGRWGGTAGVKGR